MGEYVGHGVTVGTGDGGFCVSGSKLPSYEEAALSVPNVGVSSSDMHHSHLRSIGTWVGGGQIMHVYEAPSSNETRMSAELS